MNKTFQIRIIVKDVPEDFQASGVLEVIKLALDHSPFAENGTISSVVRNGEKYYIEVKNWRPTEKAN